MIGGGEATPAPPPPPLPMNNPNRHAYLLSYHIHSAKMANRDRSEGFQVSLTTRLIKQLSLTDRQSSVSSDDEDYDRWGYFGMLPVRTISSSTILVSDL